MSTLPTSPASERNKQPILEQLLRLLPADARVLEIGSGWGQHAVFICRAMPGLRWQPSDRREELPVLQQRLAQEGSPRISSPVALDVLQDAWPARQFDAAFSANTAHIMSWPAVCASFAGVGASLVAGGQFFLYGPFNIGGCFTAPSNQAFDQSLRARNPAMGIRDLQALESLACDHQMKLQERISMPANNFLLVFKKQDRKQES